MTAYALVFIGGSLAGLLWLLLVDPVRAGRQASRQDLPTATARLDAGLVALGAGLLGARITFVLSYWQYYQSHTSEIASIAQGGLSWSGAALAAFAGLSLYALVSHQSVWPLVDALAVPVTFLAAAAWAGCLIDGCAFGRPVAAGPLASSSIDLLGNRLPRYPTQAIGSVSSLALTLGLLISRWPAVRPGVRACLALALLSAIALALAFLRGDPVPGVLGVRLDAMGAGLILALAATGLAIRSRPEGER